MLLTACSALPSADPDAIGTAMVATFAIRLTQTADARLTGTPTPTMTLTAVHTPQPERRDSTPTASPSATPGADFSGAYLLFTGTAPGGKSLLVIVVPGLAADQATYTGQAAGRDYPCYREGDHPERLYCVGPRIPPLTDRVFVLYADDGGLPLFEVHIFIFYTPTPSLEDYQSSRLCEVEPLYQPDRPELTQFQDPSRAGCYAITCWYPTGGYKCGTENSCIEMPAPPCP